MPSKNGFQLQESDIDLLNYVFQLRIATVDHVSQLCGRSVRALWGRLNKLNKRRYLASVARFMQKNVYAIGPLGVTALIEHGYASADVKEKRLRHNELTEIGIRHSLFVADIHTRMLLHTRGRPINLAQWIEGQSLWDTVPDLAIPIRPDAYFVLQNSGLPQAKNTFHIFLEADRSTMAHTRMVAKVEGYLAYYGRRQYMKKYPGMTSFIVATVTQSRSRAEELRKDLHPLIPRAAREAYPFIPFEDLTLASLAPQTAPLLLP
jgi:hypothetical protein